MSWGDPWETGQLHAIASRVREPPCEGLDTSRGSASNQLAVNEMNDMGHNSGDVVPGSEEVNAKHLRAFIERVERLQEEKKALADDIKDVYAEAKGIGFDVKIMRKIVSIRKQDHDKRIEEETILDTYMNALGMLADTPLGQAAIERATPRGTRS